MSLSSDVATPVRRPLSKRTAHPASEAPETPPSPATTLPVPDASVTLTEPANEDDSYAASLGARVQFARTYAKLSKAELARRVGVCLSAAVQWELPKGTSPNVSNLIRIATISGVGFEWLATGRGSPALADASQAPPAAADLEFEIRLLGVMRAIERERRELVVEFAQAILNQ